MIEQWNYILLQSTADGCSKNFETKTLLQRYSCIIDCSLLHHRCFRNGLARFSGLVRRSWIVTLGYAPGNVHHQLDQMLECLLSHQKWTTNIYQENGFLDSISAFHDIFRSRNQMQSLQILRNQESEQILSNPIENTGKCLCVCKYLLSRLLLTGPQCPSVME